MRSVLHPKTNFEPLEGRRLFSIPTFTAPNQGIDLQLLSDVQNDTTPAVSETVDPVKRVSLPGGFRWFDSTSNQDLIAHGGNLGYIMVDGWNVWPRDNIVGAIRTGEPSEVNTRWLANWAVTLTDTLVVDVEQWQMDIRYASEAVVNQNIARFQNIIRWLREEQPNLKIGIYSLFPVSDLYSTIQYNEFREAAADPSTGAWHRAVLPAASTQFAKLQNSDAYLAGLADSVDYIFPAIYTSSTSLDMWRHYAEGTIFNARRYGKPVIPFLMPTYHQASNMNRAVVSPEMWQMQLDLMPQIADGAIIWTDPYAPVGADEYWITMAIAKINGTGIPGVNAINRGAASSPLDQNNGSILDKKDDTKSFSDSLIADFI
jgi:hypothetical protein